MPSLRAGLKGLLLLGATLPAIFSCTTHDKVAGSEIGNPTTVALSGTALYPDGKPAGGAKVLLRRTDYLAEDAGNSLLPNSSRTALSKKSGSAEMGMVRTGAWTDNQGHFTVDSVDLGDYRLEVNDGMHQGLLIDCSVKGKKDTTLAARNLGPTTTIVGTVKWDSPPGRDYVALIYGLERAALVDPVTGKFTLDDVPRGTYNLQIGCLGRGCLSKDLENIKVDAQDTLRLDTLVLSTFAAEDYSHWLHTRKIQINTSATGADVADTLTGFPLLVRLNDSNFDFAAANPRGMDIRFANDKGTHLHFEIERWDAVLKRAEIWVRVDTVFGNNSTQSISMWWGNGEAAAYSASAQVFPPKDGYRGVWHLAEAGSSAPNAYRDATPYGNNGTGQNMSPTSDLAGVIGRAQAFNGNSSIQVAEDSSLHSGDELTVELWVNFDVLGTYKRIVSKAFPEGKFPWTEYDIETDSTAHGLAFSLGIGGNLVTVYTTTKMVTKHWYHVVGTFDGVTQSIYLDGNQEAISARTGTISDYGRAVTFGKYEHDNVSNFTGIIDEIRISAAHRTPGWIKLSYENQRSDSRLFKFLPVAP